MNEPIVPRHQQMIARLAQTDIRTDITERWSQGIDHHPRAVELAQAIEAIDWLHGGDSLGLKFGGDGDNGEFLLYSLDILCELEDAEKLATESSQS
jgi:hypothetical protein